MNKKTLVNDLNKLYFIRKQINKNDTIQIAKQRQRLFYS